MLSITDLNERLVKLEQSLSGVGYNIQSAITDDSKRKVRLQAQQEIINGFQICLCVSTDDPLNRGRIKIYHPIFNKEQIEIEKLPWANPIASLGGFDDSGGTWTPPSGSKVAIVYHNGNINDPYYLGTIWDGHRGSDGQHQPYWYFYPYMDEYQCLYEGKRNGYNFGDNSGDQVYPPWNTDSYNSLDYDDPTQFYSSEAERRRRTTPNHYGMKTPGKHYTKYVDGNPKCANKGSRLEVATGRGNVFVMKDDHLHPFKQFGYGQNLDALACQKEFPCCTDGATPTISFIPDPICPKPPGCGAGATGCTPSNKQTDSSVNRSDVKQNPFQKRREELRFYDGTPTPEAASVDLPQTGIHLQSVGGGRLNIDDSVDQPYGVPSWTLDFNFGCNNLFKGSTNLWSATGHGIRFRDFEDQPETRNAENGVYLTTAYGNYLWMSDHTERVSADACECPPNQAGSQRGIEIQTTSEHMFVMSDKGVKNCGNEQRKYSPMRKKADEKGYEGYIMLRSGYGLQLLMSDSDIQTETSQQFIQVLSPQKDNIERGPHFMIMQEQKSGPGYLLLRSGGVLYQNSYDESLEVVGDEDNNPASKFVSVTDSYLVDVKNYYFNHAALHLFMADELILLLAGRDCPQPDLDSLGESEDDDIAAAAANPGSDDGKSDGPCVFSVITSKDPWVCPLFGQVHYGVQLGSDGNPSLDSRSQRVYVSAKVD